MHKYSRRMKILLFEVKRESDVLALVCDQSNLEGEGGETREAMRIREKISGGYKARAQFFAYTSHQDSDHIHVIEYLPCLTLSKVVFGLRNKSMK